MFINSYNRICCHMEPCVGQIVRWKVRLSSFMQEKSRMLEESLYKDLHKEGDKGASFMT